MTTWQWKVGVDIVTVAGETPAAVVTALRSRSLGDARLTDEEWMADVVLRAERMGLNIGRYHNAEQFIERMAEAGLMTQIEDRGQK